MRSSYYGTRAGPRVPPRLFQIGFNRCGTKSLARFFEANGLCAAHWERGTLAASIELARREGELLLTHVDRFDVFNRLSCFGRH